MIFNLYAVVSNFAVNRAHNCIGSFFRCLFLLRCLRLYSLLSEESEPVNNESDASCFLCFQHFFFLSRLFLFDILEFVSFEELDLFDDGSDDDGSVTCTFTFCSDESIGSVSDVGSIVFIPTGIKSIGDVVPLVVFVPKGVESKGGQLIEIICRSIY